MTRYHTWAAAAALVALLAGCDGAPTVLAPESAPSLDQAAIAEGRYIVVLQDGVDPARIAAGVGVAPEYVYRHALSGFAAALPDAVRSALEQSPYVRWVEPVRIYTVFQRVAAPPADKPCRGKKCSPPPGGGGGLSCSAGTGDATRHDDLGGLWGIRKVNAPASQTWISSPVDVDVAILDTGGDLQNPDLCYHRERNFYPDGQANAQDRDGHGTHVAGTVAARDDNARDAVGVAPTARLWAVRVCGVFFCDGAAIINGIDWVTARADTIDVANMSLGGGGSDQEHAPNDCEAITGDAEHLAICRSVRAGVTYVVAAGNSGVDAAGFTPAAYDEVITVSAVDSLEAAASFTNFGADVDIIAPGVAVRSNAIGGGLSSLSGTSMASPHTAGAAALYVAQQLKATGVRPSPFAVRDAIVANGRAWAGQGGNHPEKLLDVTAF